MARRPRAIGIVDGFFARVPAVWHKEIMWVMERGVHVFGGAGLGALRAAELDSFGMRGVGQVYQAFRDGIAGPGRRGRGRLRDRRGWVPGPV